MVTVAEVLKLDRMRRGAGGAAEAMRRDGLRGASMGGTTHGTQLRAFLDAMAAQAREATAPPAMLVHPRDVAAAERSREGRIEDPAVVRSGRDDGPVASRELSGPELLWLQRLPAEPGAMAFDDAVRLARMVQTSASLDANSQMLLESYWLPVELHHDEAVARDRLAKLQPPAPVSAEARAAVAELIAAEDRSWDSTTVTAVTNQRISEFLGRARAEYEDERSALEAELERIRVARAGRSATTRTSDSWPVAAR